MPNKQIPTDHDVAERAFHLWLDEGKPDGRAQEHWHRAKEILAARDAFSAVKAGPEAPEAAKPKATRAKKAPAPATPDLAAGSGVPAKPAAKPRKPKAST